MRASLSNLASPTDTLIAVILGGMLALFSGIVATQVEAYFRRRERQREAALLFGELLATVKILLNFAGDTRKRGDPYGGVTLRMLRSVKRELDIYDRNRERLYDVQDAGLRVTLHSVMVRIGMPLEGILDTAQALAAAPNDPALDDMRASRDQGFDFLLETAKAIDPIVADLGRLARHAFDAYQPVTGLPPRADADAPPAGG